MSTGLIIALIVIVAAVLVVAAVLTLRGRGSQHGRGLKRRFGPEYDRAVARHDGDEKAAERELAERVERHGSLRQQPLEPAERQRYEDRWTAAQERFVDSPGRPSSRRTGCSPSSPRPGASRTAGSTRSSSTRCPCTTRTTCTATGGCTRWPVPARTPGRTATAGRTRRTCAPPWSRHGPSSRTSSARRGAVRSPVHPPASPTCAPVSPATVAKTAGDICRGHSTGVTRRGVERHDGCHQQAGGRGRPG